MVFWVCRATLKWIKMRICSTQCNEFWADGNCYYICEYVTPLEHAINKNSLFFTISSKSHHQRIEHIFLDRGIVLNQKQGFCPQADSTSVATRVKYHKTGKTGEHDKINISGMLGSAGLVEITMYFEVWRTTTRKYHIPMPKNTLFLTGK